MLDVCLVPMPFSRISHPNLASSLLLAAARQAGLAAQVAYGSLRFAGDIGLPAYAVLSEGIIGHGDWTFAEAAFPERMKPDEDQAHLTRILVAATRQLLIETRRKAGPFLRAWAEHIVSLKPRIVGTSLMVRQQSAPLGLLRFIKELAPETITMVGGASCDGTMALAAARLFPWVDYVVSGEADLIFAELCQKVLAGASPAELPRGVVATRSPPAVAPELMVVADVNQLPIPDFDDYFAAVRASGLGLEASYLPIESARGCWWGAKHPCMFCGSSQPEKKRFREKSPERFLRELRALLGRYPVGRVVMTDEIMPSAYPETVLPELARDPGRPAFMYEVKANLPEEAFVRMADAGVRWIGPGIESLSDEILTLLDKGTTAAANVALLKYALENGLRVTWLLMSGMPKARDEWYADMSALVPLLVHLPAPNGVSQLLYYRFSPYFERADELGLKLRPIPSFAPPPLGTLAMRDLAYAFEPETPGSPGPSDGQGPGLMALRRSVAEWQKLFFDPDMRRRRSDAPILQAEAEPARQVITDTRPCAVERTVVLEGLEDRVLRACRKPCRREHLAERLKSLGLVRTELHAEELSGAVTQLIARKLLLSLSDRLVSLPTQTPRYLFPDPEVIYGPFYEVIAEGIDRYVRDPVGSA